MSTDIAASSDLFELLMDNCDVERYFNPQRNAPCYCGSKKKYKHCCLQTKPSTKSDNIYRLTINPSTPWEVEITDPIDADFLDTFTETDEPTENQIEVLLKLKEKYPDSCALLQLLWETYHNTGQIKEANRYFNEIKKKHPNAFFIKLHAAEKLINQGKAEKALEVFDGKICIAAAFPEREEFYLSEVCEFYFFMVQYYIASDQLKKAYDQYSALKQTLTVFGLSEHHTILQGSRLLLSMAIVTHNLEKTLFDLKNMAELE